MAKNRVASRVTAHGSHARLAGVDGEAAAAYVLSRRTREGGYSYYRTPQWRVEEPNAPDTHAALASLSILGIVPPSPEETIRWLRGLQDRDGAYPTLTIGWAALSALRLLEAEPDRSPRNWLDARASRLVEAPLGEGWRRAVTESVRLVELLRMEDGALDREQRQAVALMFAEALDRITGRVRASTDLEGVALAVRLGRFAGLRVAGGSELAGYLRRCEHRELGFTIAPDSVAATVGCLRAGLALAVDLGLPVQYPGAVGEQLRLLQHADGGLGNRHLAISSLRDTWHGLIAARLLEQAI